MVRERMFSVMAGDGTRCCAVVALMLGASAGMAVGGDGDAAGLRRGVETVTPRILLRESGIGSVAMPAYGVALDRSNAAAVEDRLGWGRSFVSYYPLDNGLWAGLPSESLGMVRHGIGAGHVVDIRFSIGRPAGVSGDPDVRSMWHGNATGVDHDALGRAVLGGAVGPLESTAMRRQHVATRLDTSVSTVALSRSAALPVSIAGPGLAALRLGAMRGPTVMDRGLIGVEWEAPANSMEHPAHRRARLRAIADRASGGTPWPRPD